MCKWEITSCIVIVFVLGIDLQLEIQEKIFLIEAEIMWNGLSPEKSNIIKQVRSDDAPHRLRYKVAQITSIWHKHTLYQTFSPI